MKLTIATALAVALCLISLAARSSILAHQRAQHVAPVLSVAQVSEHGALDGLDGRLKSRMHRLARK